jgi:type II secretion system protein C
VSEWTGARQRAAATGLSLLVAAATLADMLHFALHRQPSVLLRSREQAAPLADSRHTNDPQFIVNAHLFGVDPSTLSVEPARQAAQEFDLTGVIATDDPADGYAILGEKGKSALLYHTGAALPGTGGGRIYQVLEDHVVLQFSARLEILSLPRALRPGELHRVRLAMLQEQQDETSSAPGAPPPPTPARSWFDSLYAERHSAQVSGPGFLLHPQKPVQRKYGLRDGDVLTKINGVDVGDDDALNDVLSTASPTLSLTYLRNGQPQTITVSPNN